jgi:hypothetical protein
MGFFIAGKRLWLWHRCLVVEDCKQTRASCATRALNNLQVDAKYNGFLV